MNEVTQKNKKMFLGISILLYLGGLFLFIVLNNLSSQPRTIPTITAPIPTRYPTPQPRITQPLSKAQITISPHEDIVLTPDKSQRFVITLPASLPIETVSLEMVRLSIPDENTIQVALSLSSDKNARQIIAETRIEPLQEYRLNIVNSQTKQVIYQARYLSGDMTQPLPNNTQLRLYLPHETEQYILSYNPTRNVYIFNFKIDEKNPADWETQYQNARHAAEAYIQSKKIDINSIIVEWRRS